MSAVWRKSVRSYANGNCVETTFLAALIGVRDSKNPYGPALFFTRTEWAAFLVAAKRQP
jgi:hypothetical protein